LSIKFIQMYSTVVCVQVIEFVKYICKDFSVTARLLMIFVQLLLQLN